MRQADSVPHPRSKDSLALSLRWERAQEKHIRQLGGGKIARVALVEVGRDLSRALAALALS